MYIRCLLHMYTSQTLRVKWQGCFSNTFTVMNGVKQGGVLSPTLFGIYIENLLEKLQDTNAGCYVGPYFVGSLAYADDLVLLSPTKAGLNKLMLSCEKFSRDYKVQFNGSKSQFLIFHNDKLKSLDDCVTFCGSQIRNQEYAIHLGHKIYANLRLDDTAGVTASFYKQVNMFKSKFKTIPSYIQAKLFVQYCSSFYGLQLLQGKHYNKLEVAWRKSLRKIWKLSPLTHCSLLVCLSKGSCIRHMLIKRFMTFAQSLICHKDSLNKYIMQKAFENDNSVLRRNFDMFSRELIKLGPFQ